MHHITLICLCVQNPKLPDALVELSALAALANAANPIDVLKTIGAGLRSDDAPNSNSTKKHIQWIGPPSAAMRALGMRWD